MQTLETVEAAKNCYQTYKTYKCCGDSGEIQCFFCPACVISLEERVYNLRMFDLQIFNSKK